MYVPKHFEESDPARIRALIERHAFGLLVSTVAGGPFASHVPFLRESDTRLLCHVARANPQWREIDGAEVLAIFTGPHAYVSPSWYDSPGVPTWNYVSAHVVGRATVVTEPERVREIVDALAAAHEANITNPWRPSYPLSMLDQIAGIEIEVTELQAKAKLGQNRTDADQLGVIEQLRARGSDDARDIAELMAGRLRQRRRK